ncbi:hypothetical protein ACHWQZ_G012101 [Mnemiopsis leidyi]
MTAVVANAEEELLLSVVEKVALKPCEASSAYEDIVISHSTAIQNDRNLVHQDFRRRSESSKVISVPPTPRRLYSDVLLVGEGLGEGLGEPTHVAHIPSNRLTIQPSESNYTIHKFQFNREAYQDTLIIGQCLSKDTDKGLVTDSDSEEDLEELPRFRSRLAPVGPKAKASARAIRSGTLSGDEIEIMRHCHEQDYGIPLLNELRDTIPKLSITEPGNSMFYETAFPLNTPKSAAVNSADPCCYENTDYFTRSRVALLAEEDKAGFLSSTIVEEADEDEPIYSKPIKPKTKKISRSECEDVLEKCRVGDYMLRRNKETVILSVKVHTKVKHIKLEFDRDTVKVGKESFNSLPEMMTFYQNSVPVSLVKEPVFLAREIDSDGLVK